MNTNTGSNNGVATNNTATETKAKSAGRPRVNLTKVVRVVDNRIIGKGRIPSAKTVTAVEVPWNYTGKEVPANAKVVPVPAKKVIKKKAKVVAANPAPVETVAPTPVETSAPVINETTSAPVAPNAELVAA